LFDRNRLLYRTCQRPPYRNTAVPNSR